MMRVCIYGDDHTSCFCLGLLLKETHFKSTQNRTQVSNRTRTLIQK